MIISEPNPVWLSDLHDLHDTLYTYNSEVQQFNRMCHEIVIKRLDTVNDTVGYLAKYSPQRPKCMCSHFQPQYDS